MNPREHNILSSLNVLVLVFRAQKHLYPKLSEEQQHTLKITKEHLASANLAAPIFINTLAELNKKGYVYALSVFEEKYHPEILKFLDDAEYARMLKEFEKQDTSAFTDSVNVALADMLKEAAPANIPIDRAEVLAEPMDIKSILEAAREGLQGYFPDVVSTVILSPFRDIERLLEKMNRGTAFDDVKDPGIWYDPIACELHFDEIAIPTSYQGKPNKEHYALKALFSQFDESRIDYSDIPEFDIDNKEKDKKAFFDALDRLLKKHPRLKEVFSVHTDHLSIQGEFLEHPH